MSPTPLPVPLHTPLPIFVYGTLKAGQRNHDAHFPAGGIRSIVAAKVHDVGLFEDDRIPYASPVSGRTLYGEVITLAQDSEEATFSRVAIDRLEGFDPAVPEAGWYRRLAITAVTLAAAAPVQCWIYVMDRPPQGTRPVSGGVWLSGTRSDAPPER